MHVLHSMNLGHEHALAAAAAAYVRCSCPAGAAVVAPAGAVPAGAGWSGTSVLLTCLLTAPFCSDYGARLRGLARKYG